MPDSESAPKPSPDSKPSASNYAPELPLAGDLQQLLPPGQYIIERFLGQGGMGAVYKGLQMPLRRPVAVKIMQKGASSEFDFEERFRREAYAMAALMHPHIVHVYDCGDAGPNYLFISMELVEGGDLSQLLKAGKMTQEYALQLLVQICDALQAAHDRGIIHRDIKPANIFITGDGRAKVADFGLAKTMDARSFMTQTGMGMGTPDYAAPEQFEGAKDLDHRADVYALGVMMYQMLTGVLPRGAYRSPSQRAAVDPRLDDMVFKAMEHAREDRYQSVAELKADILSLAKPAPKTASGASMVGSMPLHPVAAPRAQKTATPGATSGPMKPAPQRASAPVERTGGMGKFVGMLGAMAVIGAGAFFLMKKREPATAGASPAAQAPAFPNAKGPAPASTPPDSTTAPSLPATSPMATQTGAVNIAPSIAPSTVGSVPRVPTPPSAVGSLSEIANVLTSPDYAWSKPINLGPNINTSGVENFPTLSADGLILVYRGSTASGGASLIYEARRRSLEETFGAPVEIAIREGPPSNCTLSPDGLTLIYRVSGRQDFSQISRADRNSPWKPPVSLGLSISDFTAMMPLGLSHDALTLIFASDRAGGKGSGDLYRQRRSSVTAPWGAVEAFGSEVNTDGFEYCGFLMRDNRTLVFLRYERTATSFGIGKYLVGVADDNDRLKVAPLEGITAGGGPSPWFSPDGRTMWFSSSTIAGGLGKTDLWETRRVPKGSAPMVAAVQPPQPARNPSPSTPAATGPATVGGQRFDFQGHRYEIVTGPPFFSQTQAKAKAEAAGGHLATITSKEENDFLQASLASIATEAKVVEAYIGAQSSNAGKDWAWFTGEPFTFFGTASSYTGSNTSKSSANALAIRKAANGVTWDQLPSNYMRGYIVEWDNAGPVEPVPTASPQPASTAPPPPGPDGTHTWTDSKGRAIQAKFVRLQVDTVILVIAGRERPLPMNTLSAESQNLARNLEQRAGVGRANKDAPFINSLGMKFVPVPIKGGPTDGRRVLFNVWDTRVQDYEIFARETNRSWSKPAFEQGPTHPAVNVNWEDSVAFCAWLTGRERAAGKIQMTDAYRLPSDHEWSCAVGIGDKEDATEGPRKKSGKIPDIFPWGTKFPPPDHAGNYASEESVGTQVSGREITAANVIGGYRDGFAFTSPVGSYAANEFGLYDMGGNVWQWCEDPSETELASRAQRGGAWNYYSRFQLQSSSRVSFPATSRASYFGFRCVLAPEASAAPSPSPSSAARP